MKVREYKNKIVLAELDPKAKYLMLISRDYVRPDDIQLPGYDGPGIWLIPVRDVDKAVRFVEVPHTSKKEKP